MAIAQRNDIVELPPQTLGRAEQLLPIAGFGGGTLITTDDGYIPVDWLRAGDQVLTYNDGFQPVRWIGRDCLNRPPQDVAAINLPIPASNGKVATHTPVLTARHRIVLTGWQIDLYFGMDALLVEAQDLGDMLQTFPPVKSGATACTHILMDSHQIIQANGCWVETMQLTSGAMASLNKTARDKITRLGLNCGNHTLPALGCIKPWEAHQLDLDLQSMITYAAPHQAMR